jgi:hypothetical protein
MIQSQTQGIINCCHSSKDDLGLTSAAAIGACCQYITISLSPAVGVELPGQTATTGVFTAACASAIVDHRRGRAMIAFKASPIVNARKLAFYSAADRQLHIASKYGADQIFITNRSEVDSVLCTNLL